MKKVNRHLEVLEIQDIMNLLEKIKDIYPKVYDEQIQKIIKEIKKIIENKYQYLGGHNLILSLIPSNIKEFDGIRKIIKDKIIYFENLIEELSIIYETYDIDGIVEFKNKNELQPQNRNEINNKIKELLHRFSIDLCLEKYNKRSTSIIDHDYDKLKNYINKVDGLIEYNEIIDNINILISVEAIYDLFLSKNLSNIYLCELLSKFLIIKIKIILVLIQPKRREFINL